MSGALARQKAAELRTDASEGKSLMATKQARRAIAVEASNDTFEVMILEWHASRISNWDTGTAKRVMGALERHALPVFGNRQYRHHQACSENCVQPGIPIPCPRLPRSIHYWIRHRQTVFFGSSKVCICSIRPLSAPLSNRFGNHQRKHLLTSLAVS